MKVAVTRRAAYGVLVSGALLRVALLIVTPARIAHDNHYPPIEIIADQHRLPRADECWECYQPPLYYLTSAVPYQFVKKSLIAAGAPGDRAVAVARKVVQSLSTLYGILTLWVCLRILNALPGMTDGVRATALAVPALLPQHLYMSAMATNDALAYLWAGLAILYAVRLMSDPRPVRAAMSVGLFLALGILTKGYGLVTAGAVVVALALMARIRPSSVDLSRQNVRRFPSTPVIALLALCAAFAWSCRNLHLYGRLHVDNFDFFETPMKTQPPGNVADVEWATFRYASLLARPWVHNSHLASFPTELFARYWFDYEGLTMSLSVSDEWRRHQRGVRRSSAGTSRDDWHRLLDWAPQHVPASLLAIGRGSYLAGLPLTLLILAGTTMAPRRIRAEPIHVLMLLHLAACLFVPVFQTLRLPCISAMKSAFTLSALPSAAWLAAVALRTFTGAPRRVMLTSVWLCLLAIAAADVGFIAYMAARAG